MKKENSLRAIAAGLLAVLAAPIVLPLFLKKKGNDSAKSQPKTIDDLIAQFGEPDDIVLLDATRGNDPDYVVLCYDKSLIINGIEIKKSDIAEITFNNAAVAYMPNDYQIIVVPVDPQQPFIHLRVGLDGTRAMQITEQLKAIVAAQ